MRTVPEACDGKIWTFTGKLVDPFNLQPEDIDIEDIAHALSMQCRFGGHSAHFYSVAAHSVLVSEMVDPSVKWHALLHDAAEAYFIDLPRPIKNRFPEYRQAEEMALGAILERFGLWSMGSVDIYKQVKEADNKALEMEIEALIRNNIGPDTHHYLTTKFAPTAAKSLFLMELQPLLCVQ